MFVLFISHLQSGKKKSQNVWTWKIILFKILYTPANFNKLIINPLEILKLINTSKAVKLHKLEPGQIVVLDTRPSSPALDIMSNNPTASPLTFIYSYQQSLTPYRLPLSKHPDNGPPCFDMGSLSSCPYAEIWPFIKE